MYIQLKVLSTHFEIRCEYILYRGLYRTSYARLSRGIVTDTELQLAQFVLPRYGFGVIDETREARTIRAHKEELPECHVRKSLKPLYNLRIEAKLVVVTYGVLRR